MKRIGLLLLLVLVALPLTLAFAQVDTPDSAIVPVVEQADGVTRFVFAGPRYFDSSFTVTGGFGISMGEGYYALTYYDVGPDGSGAGEEIIKFIKIPHVGVTLIDDILPDFAGPCAGSSVNFGTTEKDSNDDIAYLTGSAGGVVAWKIDKWGGFAGYGRIEGDFDDNNLYESHVDIGIFAWIRL